MSAFKNIRLMTGMSQREFSKLLGVERVHYAQAEAGLRPLNVEGGMQLLNMQEHLQQTKEAAEFFYLEEEIVQESSRQ